MRIVSPIVLMGVLMASSCIAAAQAVWKYVDEQGVTHYTDQPVPGAEKIELSSGNTAAPSSNSGPVTSATTRAAQQGAYRLFQIVRPANQESVLNTGGVVQVSMQLDPALQTGHIVTLYLDGQLVEDFPPNALDHELQSVPRGEHTLVGVITDANRRRVTETSKVTFTVRQKSILMNPPVGPSVRPPPKPPTATPRAPVRGSQPSFADLNPDRTAPAESPSP
jgi:hypothetical protein